MALADRLETNNTIATASTLTGTSGTQTALTIHSTTDQDYFKIILTGTGTASNFVKAAFAHASGDLDMRLYNAAGTQVTSASSITNDETISLSGLAAGTYYAQVYGYGGATNAYDLSWNVA